MADENKFPIPVPSTDTGWKAMREQLDDEMPEGAATITNKATNTRSSYKLKRLLVLLLIFFLGGAIAIWLNKNGNSNNIKGLLSDKYSPVKKLKSSSKTDNENSYRNNETKEGDEKSDETNINSGVAVPETALTEVISSKENSGSNIDNKKNQLHKNPTKQTTQFSKEKHPAKNPSFKKGKPKLNNKKQASGSLPVKQDISSNTKQNDPVVQQRNLPDSSLAVIRQKTERKADSATTDITPEPESNEWKINGGLYWNLQLPTASAGNYFTGANTRSQPYRIILPGAWLQAQSDKHLLTIEINPFASNLVPAKAFRTATSYASLPDTNVVIVETKTLKKLFGVSAGLGYAYNVSGNWWLGGGLQFSSWRKALASTDGEVQKIPNNGSPARINSFKANYTLSDEWSYFTKFQLNLNAEGMYRTDKWQAGLRMGFGATSLAQKEGPSHSLRIEFLYRLKLFNIRMADERKQAGIWAP